MDSQDVKDKVKNVVLLYPNVAGIQFLSHNPTWGCAILWEDNFCSLFKLWWWWWWWWWW
jgi:hypothetical protein